MNVANNVAKVLLTLPLIIFGLNKLVPEPFISSPPPAGETAQLYMEAFFGTYLGKAVAFFEVAGSILVWVKKTELLGLIVLFPIILNINLFHLFHAIDGILIGAVIMVAEIYMLYSHKDRLCGLIIN